MSEFVVAPVANIYPVPDGLEEGAATLIQVLTTCVHGQRMDPIAAGTSVVVIGMGVTGSLHLQLAKLAGAHPVVCTSRSASKLELAQASVPTRSLRRMIPGRWSGCSRSPAEAPTS